MLTDCSAQVATRTLLVITLVTASLYDYAISGETILTQRLLSYSSTIEVKKG